MSHFRGLTSFFYGRRSRPIRSYKRRKEQKRILFVRSSIALFVVIVFVAAISFITHRPEITIRSVIINGSSAGMQEKLRLYTKEKLIGNYFKLFPKANIFLFSRKGIEEGLLNSFPNLSSVSASFNDFQSISIFVEERKNRYLWCGEELPDENVLPQKCYFLDGSGIIFAPAPYFSGNVYFEFFGLVTGKQIRMESSAEYPLGFYAFPESSFRFIIGFKNSLEGKSFIVQRAFIKEEGGYEFILNNGSRIIFDESLSIENLMGNLEVGLETDVLKKVHLIADSTSLEYVDLRFNNKIFYKFK